MILRDQLAASDSTVFLAGARHDWLAAPAGELPGDDDYETFADFVRAYSEDYDDATIVPGRVRRSVARATTSVPNGATSATHSSPPGTSLWRTWPSS